MTEAMYGPSIPIWVGCSVPVDYNDGQQGYYDRTFHAIYEGLTFEDPNGYGYPSLPLIGPGRREDHNCMWDLNAFTGVMEPARML